MFGKGMSDYLRELLRALDESVKLQSHYAGILNSYDGGTRLQFADADAWMKRLADLEKDESDSMNFRAAPTTHDPE